MHVEHWDVIGMERRLLLVLHLVVRNEIGMLSTHLNGNQIWVSDGNPIHVHSNAM